MYLLLKTLSKVGTEENFLSLIKGVYKNFQLTSFLMMKEWTLPYDVSYESGMSALIPSIPSCIVQPFEGS